MLFCLAILCYWYNQLLVLDYLHLRLVDYMLTIVIATPSSIHTCHHVFDVSLVNTSVNCLKDAAPSPVVFAFLCPNFCFWETSIKAVLIWPYLSALCGLSKTSLILYAILVSKHETM